MATTKKTFEYKKDDFFQIVDEWAKEEGFKIKEKGNDFMLLQKGGYLSWNAHPRLYVELKNGNAVIDAWINPIWGGRMEISSDSVVGVLAKNAAREKVNKLLSKFGQSPIL